MNDLSIGYVRKVILISCGLAARTDTNPKSKTVLVLGISAHSLSIEMNGLFVDKVLW